MFILFERDEIPPDLLSYFEPMEEGKKPDVWSIPTHGFPLAHFATFPPALVEPCIKAGTSERGVCAECGKPWVRVVEKQQIPDGAKLTRAKATAGANSKHSILNVPGSRRHMIQPRQVTGWTSSCICDAGQPVPATVLDIFCGSGTTLQVARALGRNSIGLDLSMPYLRDQARTRLGLDVLAAWQNGTGIKAPRVDHTDLPIFQQQEADDDPAD